MSSAQPGGSGGVPPAQPGGRLYVLSGPGGVGKGTVVEALRRRLPDLAVSVSATTRPPRPDEVDGVQYHFVDERGFDDLIARGALLEWAEFGGYRYGTPWASVEGPLADGRPVLLEIDVQGALQVRERFPRAVLIFLAPPGRDALRARLEQRGADTEDRIAERLKIAEWELAQIDAFDHVVVNHEVDAAAEAVARILREVSERQT